MKRSTGIAVGIATSLALGLGTAAYAHQGEKGDGAHARGGMQHGMKGGMGHGAANQLMTPEERTALREQMRNATPDERSKMADATHAKMQARALERGLTLPQHRGPKAGAAVGSSDAAQTSGDAEHAH